MRHSKKIIGGSLVIAIFVLIVSLTSWYVQLQIEAGTICSCAIPLPILIPFVSSIGLLVGTLVYYMYSPESKDKKIERDSVLKFLDPPEREIMDAILDNNGEVSQARIVSETGIPKVRVFRSLERLRAKGIIMKERFGKTNLIKLPDDVRKIFE